MRNGNAMRTLRCAVGHVVPYAELVLVLALIPVVFLFDFGGGGLVFGIAAGPGERIPLWGLAGVVALVWAMSWARIGHDRACPRCIRVMIRPPRPLRYPWMQDARIDPDRPLWVNMLVCGIYMGFGYVGMVLWSPALTVVLAMIAVAIGSVLDERHTGNFANWPDLDIPPEGLHWMDRRGFASALPYVHVLGPCPKCGYFARFAWRTATAPDAGDPATDTVHIWPCGDTWTTGEGTDFTILFDAEDRRHFATGREVCALSMTEASVGGGELKVRSGREAEA